MAKKTDAQRQAKARIAKVNSIGADNPVRRAFQEPKARAQSCVNQYNDCDACGLPFIVPKGSITAQCRDCRKTKSV